MALFYADTSALVKLVLAEPESGALRSFLDGADLVTCDLALAELPRVVRRAVAKDERLPLKRLLACTSELLESVALLPLERPLLLEAGALAEPALRTLDAIHVAAGAAVEPTDGFLTYDERQAAAARLARLRTFAPGRS